MPDLDLTSPGHSPLSQGWEWPKKKNTENNILVPKALITNAEGVCLGGGGLGALPQENLKK